MSNAMPKPNGMPNRQSPQITVFTLMWKVVEDQWWKCMSMCVDVNVNARVPFDPQL